MAGIAGSPGSARSTVEGFGVDIHLVADARVKNRTVSLTPREARLMPTESSLVTRWVGNIGSGTGYQSPPGVPVEGSVTLKDATAYAAQGHFVYRYADGGGLTCTFDVLKDGEE
ncbi:hypothetical protein [Corallococcus exiguus]|uniref:hypothetical protein n=1 Tax=Corallococcus exiguus TaxID=83462 RepID=UPI003DA4157E